MKRLFVFAVLILAVSVPCSCQIKMSDNSQERAAQELCIRVLGPMAGEFMFTQGTLDSKGCEGDTVDFFTIRDNGAKVEIVGNNSNSMAVGLNFYLKYWCNVEYGWAKDDSPLMPDVLPEVGEPVTVKARVPERFFLNYCTFGYSMPWWRWEDWEHFIDWMALNGVNLPLAITGQESIWYQIWTEMGLSDEQVRSYFTGPAHLPWHRMQNIDRWGGPLPKSWLDGQLELQKKITERERELGMKPVLPAFSGHVPRELKEIYPDAGITSLGSWAGYSEEYECSFLDPMSELYSQIQKKFIEKESEIYGTNHIYGLDLFNEVTPPSWEPEYLARVSRQVYESLRAADPQARWLQMGWLFYNESKQWTGDRIKAYLSSCPADNQMILDYYCENTEVWKRTDSFYGVPFIWCYLGNFGGNTNLLGSLYEINSRFDAAYANNERGNLRGIGSTLEGLDCNPFVYEFVLEKAWDMFADNVHFWTENLACRRCGYVDPAGERRIRELGEEAWIELVDSVHVDVATSAQGSYFNFRPDIGKRKGYWYTAGIKYDNRHLVNAIGKLLKANGRGSSYEFDLVNLTRQMLTNVYDEMKIAHDSSFAIGDTAAMHLIQPRMMELLDDIDTLMSTQSFFLLGKWLDDARSWGVTEQEKDYFERNARNLITTWSDAGMSLNDYACRTWNGLVGTYCRARLAIFFKHLNAVAALGRKWDDDAYKAYFSEVTEYEQRWWKERIGTFPSKPNDGGKEMVRRLFDKYSVIR